MEHTAIRAIHFKCINMKDDDNEKNRAHRKRIAMQAEQTQKKMKIRKHAENIRNFSCKIERKEVKLSLRNT